MNIFLVYPSAQHGWSLLREDEEYGLHFSDKERAISYGRDVALANRPSMLRVETWYGGIEATWFFGETAAARAVASAYRLGGRD